MAGLQIYAPRERALVAAADAALRPLAWARRLKRRADPTPPQRVLLLRLERIGDLLMALDAIDLARASWPQATIDLAVGSWNAPLARLIPGIDAVLTADAPWLAREGSGDSWPTLISRVRAWRRARYDLVLNFEPDIRSNFLAWRTGAPRRFGFWTGGGGAFLTRALAFKPARHVGDNAEQLVREAGGPAPAPTPAIPLTDARRVARLQIPAEADARAAAALAGLRTPLVGMHVAGGRESKQWHLDRFADVARHLARDRGATIVLTGTDADRTMVASVAARLGGAPFLDLAGRLDLVDLAAVMARLDLFVASDTGPMHLAAAVGTPVVALFGPADPRRYGPRARVERILRVDLPCSPCGQVRLPPLRCRGKVPDCMDGIDVDPVVAAAIDVLDQPRVAATADAR
jgi:ADP-heptose:LPS heptosyltransferase